MRLNIPDPQKTIDLSGLRCPHIIVATIRALRTLDPGQILQVTTTDLNSPSNLAAWSRQSGQLLLEMYDADDSFVFFLQRQEEAILPKALADVSSNP